MTEILVAALPLLALLAALLLGHYPGCDAVLRLSERFSVRRSRRAIRSGSLARPQPSRALAPAGGLLIAFGLARRPPPLAP